MPLPHRYRRTIILVVLVLGGILLLRWIANSTAEYVVTNYFHQRISASPGTDITYDLKDLHLQWLERRVNLEDVRVFIEQEQGEEQKAQYELFVPNFTIDLQSVGSLLWEHTLAIEEITLEHPSVRVTIPQVQDSVVLRQEVGNLHQQTTRFLQELNLQHFALNLGSFSWSTSSSSSPRYQLRDVSVRMDNIHLTTDSLMVNQMTELALTDHVEVTLHNESLLLPDEKHTLRFKKLHISSQSDMVLIDSLHLYAAMPDGEISGNFNSNSIEVPQLQVKGLDFLALYLDNHLLVDTILVGETDLHLEIGDDQSIVVLGDASDQGNHGLDSIHIRRVEVTPSAISIKHSESTTINTFKMDSATLALNNVTHTEQEDTIFAWNVRNLELRLRKYQSKLAELHYNFGFNKLDWSFADKSFSLKKVTVYPLHDSVPDADSRPLRYVEVPSVTVTDLNFTELFTDRKLNGGSIRIEQPRVGLVIPGSHANSKKEPVDISLVLQQFFTSFRLDRLAIEDGQIDLFHEQGPAFLTLKGVGLLGNNWRLNESSFTLDQLPTELSFARGNLQLPDTKVRIDQAQYNNTTDELTAQKIRVQTSNEQLNASATLDHIALKGIIPLISTNQLDQASIAAIDLAVNVSSSLPSASSKSTTSFTPFIIDQLSIDHLTAQLEQAESASLSLNDASVEIQDFSTQKSAIPITFDQKRSRIHFKYLSVQHPNGSGTLDSLSFTNGNIAFYQLTGQSEDTLNSWNALIPQLEINRWQFPDESNTWQVGKIALTQPQINVVQSPSEVDTATTSNSNSTSPTFQLLVDTLQVAQANWSLKNNNNSWESPSTTVSSYNFKYPLNLERPASQNILLSVEDFKQSTTVGKLQVGLIEADVQQQTLRLQHSNFNLQTSTPQINGLNLQAVIPQVSLKLSNLDRWKEGDALAVDEFSIVQPAITVSWDSLNENPKPTVSSSSESKFPLSALLIDKFQLADAAFKTNNASDQPRLKLNGLNLNYNNFRWNSKQSLDPGELLAEGDWSVGLKKMQAAFSSPTMLAGLYGLQVASGESPITWDSLQFAPQAGPEEFSNYITHQKSWLSIATGSGRVRGIDWQEAANASFRIDNVHIAEPSVRVYRDQRLPFPENHYPPLLHEALLNFTKPLHIDTLELNNGAVYAEVRPKAYSETGKLNFSNLEAILTNVTNVKEKIQADKIMRLDAFAQIQQAGLMKVHVDFDLEKPNYPFFTNVNIGPMDLRRLNTMVEPVAAVRIKSGKMRELDFQVMADDDFAYGNMDFMYRKLHLSIVGKKHKKHPGVGLAIESFLANNLILRKNNDYPFPHRQGQVFIERDKTRSIFNYWGKIAISGILTSAGVKSNRKALHQQFAHKRQQLEDNKVTTSSSDMK